MLIALSLLTPLVLATAIPLAGVLVPAQTHVVRRFVAMIAPVTVIPAIALAVFGNEQTLQLPWLLVGSDFHVDAIARPLLLIAALLYGAAMMAVTWLKLRDTDRGSGALTAFLLVSFTGNIGTYLAADAVSFYLAFALMSFSAAGLVIHYRSPDSQRATRIYLVMSVYSETAILAGLLLAVHAGGYMLTQAPSAIAHSEFAGLTATLLATGFGVKAGTIPLHIWLPLAHPAAPPPASAVLSGAMVKAGLVGWLRFLPLTEGIALPSALEILGWVLLVLALVGAFAAVLLGVVQQDPKVVLAYSTISQMGFIAAVVAAGLIDPQIGAVAAAAAVVYAVHHGLAKGALFLGVPVVKHYARGITGVVVVIGMVGAGLAVAGAPLTSGAFGKYVSKEAVAPLSIGGIGLDSILPLVATGSTLLLIRFAWLLWNQDRDPRRAPDGELFSWLLVAATGIIVPWLIGERWTTVSVPDWDASVVWNAIWPILLGLALGGFVWLLAARGWLPAKLVAEETVPPGDIVVPEERLVNTVHSHGAALLDRLHDATHAFWDRGARGSERFAARVRSTVGGAERSLSQWGTTGLVVLVVLALIVTLIWLLGGFA